LGTVHLDSAPADDEPVTPEEEAVVQVRAMRSRAVSN
jgi:hypothetical protein